MNTETTMIKKLTLHIILLLSTLISVAQLSFDYEATSKVQTIKISKDIGWQHSSWIIGAFVKRGKKYHCVGATEKITHPILEDITFFVYGEDDQKIGYQEGEALQLFMYRDSEECYNKITHLKYNVVDTVEYFHNQSVIELTQIDSVTFGEIYYNGNIFCTFYEQITPLIIDIDIDLITFSTYNNQLKIDEELGIIYPQESVYNKSDSIIVTTNHCIDTPEKNYGIVYPAPHEQMNLSYLYCDTFPISINSKGNGVKFTRNLQGISTNDLVNDTTLIYNVSVENGCSFYDTVNINVHTISINEIEAIIQDETCVEKGKIEIVENYDDDITYYLNGIKQENSIFENLQKDIYELIAQNEQGCRDTLENMLEVTFIEQNCNDTETLHLIFSNVEHDHLVFTNSEKITIYNKKGKLVKELYGPIDWNGIDLSGNLLSTGLYIVQYESGKQQYLKVIY